MKFSSGQKILTLRMNISAAGSSQNCTSFEDLFSIDCTKAGGDQASRTKAGRWGRCSLITVSSSNWFQGLIFCHPAAAADCESRWIHFLQEMNETSVRDKMDVGEHTWTRVWVTFTHFPPQNILLWLLWTAGDGRQVRQGRADSIFGANAPWWGLCGCRERRLLSERTDERMCCSIYTLKRNHENQRPTDNYFF